MTEETKRIGLLNHAIEVAPLVLPAQLADMAMREMRNGLWWLGKVRTFSSPKQIEDLFETVFAPKAREILQMRQASDPVSGSTGQQAEQDPVLLADSELRDLPEQVFAELDRHQYWHPGKCGCGWKIDDAGDADWSLQWRMHVAQTIVSSRVAPVIAAKDDESRRLRNDLTGRVRALAVALGTKPDDTPTGGFYGMCQDVADLRSDLNLAVATRQQYAEERDAARRARDEIDRDAAAEITLVTQARDRALVELERARSEIERLEDNEEFLDRALHLVLGCCDPAVPANEDCKGRARAVYDAVRTGRMVPFHWPTASRERDGERAERNRLQTVVDTGMEALLKIADREVWEYPPSLLDRIELVADRLREARAERDELRAHGVARDIGEANEQLRAELDDLRHNLAQRAFTAPDADIETMLTSLDSRIRDALRTNVRLVWLPEFGEDEEIALGEPIVHNGADGRFVLRTKVGQSDTEASEQAEPRVWRDADDPNNAQPSNVYRVHDADGHVWEMKLGGDWACRSGRTPNVYAWFALMAQYGPLTEIVSGSASTAEEKP
jgi:hypothetical protein